VVKQTGEVASRTHNLFSLSEAANIEINEDDDVFLGTLMKYQLQGRYPDYNPEIHGKRTVEVYLDRTEKIMLWLNRML
jgi:hypothetical protein